VNRKRSHACARTDNAFGLPRLIKEAVHSALSGALDIAAGAIGINSKDDSFSVCIHVQLTPAPILVQI
jgi:hypothetical protein